MTDNEIVKGLECCVQDGYPYGCKNCPYRGEDCNETLDADALSLINRQKAEIERLNKANTTVVEHLKKARKQLKAAKAKAIKEFNAMLYAYKTDIYIKGVGLIIIPDTDYNEILKDVLGGDTE